MNKNKLLPYFVVFSALSVSVSAAFYSVSGIGKMFSGASIQVMIMMASLEISKLVIASMLYQYWGKFNNMLKFYYTISLVVLMAITSAGIYGYLSSAYSETSNKVESMDKQISVLDVKRGMFQDQLDDVRAEKQRINENISDLTKGISNNFVQVKDKSGQIITTTSSSNRKSFESQLQISQKRRDELSSLESSISDSIYKLDITKLDIETSGDIAGEVGPLRYISRLTGKSMDVVVNWFIIALMIVFDPLAVSLVIGANIIFKHRNEEKEEDIDVSDISEKLKSFQSKENDFKKMNSDFEMKMNDLIEKENFIKAEKEKLEKLKELIKSSKKPSKRNTMDDIKKLENLKSEIEEKEKNIELYLNDIKRLDNEIRVWESTHWKMRRNRTPPSAIIDDNNSTNK